MTVIIVSADNLEGCITPGGVTFAAPLTEAGEAPRHAWAYPLTDADQAWLASTHPDAELLPALPADWRWPTEG